MASGSGKTSLSRIGGAAGALFGVWVERRKAVAGLEARAEKLNEILNEVRAVKDVETRFAGKEWNRQSLWQEKRDAYAKLFVASHAVMNMLYQKDDNPEVWNQFSLADSYARLFASKSCSDALDSFWKGRGDSAGRSLEEQAQDALSLVENIIKIANVDLLSDRVRSI